MPSGPAVVCGKGVAHCVGKPTEGTNEPVPGGARDNADIGGIPALGVMCPMLPLRVGKRGVDGACLISGGTEDLPVGPIGPAHDKAGCGAVLAGEMLVVSGTFGVTAPA
mmetsp:Transcript_14997/g.41298  ORF Transcript_14997/g.41298 Transcript_14997/m.41298 type:complete len:109 (-) Transcript_14997:160-486(-)